MKVLRGLRREILVACLSFPVAAAAQSSPLVSYDVSTVKPHDSADRNMSWGTNENGFYAINVELKSVIAGAWDLRPDQVVGEPAWADDLHWDFTGKSTELTSEQLKTLTPAQQNQMMQQLLAERFLLKAHLEKRTGSVFTLVPAKGGIKLKPIPMTAEQKASGVPDSGMGIRGGQAAVMDAKKITLSSLIANLAMNLHQTVIDKTGLPPDSVYSFTLRWAPDYGTGSSTESDAPPLSAALEEQLGLRVEASRGPVQVLVVDHLEKPTAN